MLEDWKIGILLNIGRRYRGVPLCLLLLSSSVICSKIAFAQDYPRKEINPERLVDELFPQQNLDINYQLLYENLLQQLSHPMDLNHASVDELRSLFILSEEQTEALISWREEFGLLLSVYELQSIPSFDLITIYKLMPFVYVRDLTTTLDKAFLNRLVSENDSYFILRSGGTLQSQKGYLKTTDSASRYAGSPEDIYARFRMSRPGDFSFGFTAEKDAGEPLMFNPSKHYYGMDFFSFHAQAVRKGWVKNLIVGDFLAQFGQGLALGGGFGMGKGSETITTLRRSTLGFMPYTSVNESNFFRGIAASIGLTKNFTIHSFASGLRRDAIANQDSTNEDYSFISSFAVTGLHRTPGEIASRKQILEINYGSVLNYKSVSVEAGIIFHRTTFSLPITRNPTDYNQFSFNGNQNSNLSAFCNYTKNNFTFFSEAAQTWEHGSAFIAGLLGSVTRQLDISLLYRRYQKNFFSFYSNAIAENTLPQNESGYYVGWKYALSKKYSWSGYLDMFHFPWLRYRAYAPGGGNEWLLRFNYQPSKTVLMYAQFREGSKIRNLSNDDNLYQTGRGVKHSLWINSDYGASASITFKTRAQFSSYAIGGNTTRGFVLLQDFNADIGRFSFSVRYSLFHTDDYDNRQYVYEQDVWLAFSFPAYYGTGVHSHFLTRFRISKTTDVWIRWSHTRYTDRTIIGTGGETINGSVRDDVKLQLRRSF
jgi:hypothetical protein